MLKHFLLISSGFIGWPSSDGLASHGWYRASLSPSMLRTCPRYIDQGAIQRQALSVFEKDEVGSHVKGAAIGALSCANQAKIIFAFIEAPDFQDLNFVIILNEDGQYIGKLLLPAFGNKTWDN